MEEGFGSSEMKSANLELQVEAFGSGSDEVLLRYCHLFEKGELSELCAEVDGVCVLEELWDCSNCCVTLRKN